MTLFISHPFQSLNHLSLRIGPWLQYWLPHHQRLHNIPLPLMELLPIHGHHLQSMRMPCRLSQFLLVVPCRLLPNWPTTGMTIVWRLMNLEPMQPLPLKPLWDAQLITSNPSITCSVCNQWCLFPCWVNPRENNRKRCHLPWNLRYPTHGHLSLVLSIWIFISSI